MDHSNVTSEEQNMSNDSAQSNLTSEDSVQSVVSQPLQRSTNVSRPSRPIFTQPLQISMNVSRPSGGILTWPLHVHGIHNAPNQSISLVSTNLGRPRFTVAANSWRPNQRYYAIGRPYGNRIRQNPAQHRSNVAQSAARPQNVPDPRRLVLANALQGHGNPPSGESVYSLHQRRQQSPIPTEDWQDPGAQCLICLLPVWCTNYEIRESCGHYYHSECFYKPGALNYQNCSLCQSNVPGFMVNLDRLIIKEPTGRSEEMGETALSARTSEDG